MITKPSVAIVKSDFHSHSSCWSHVWISYCVENDYPYTLIDWKDYKSFEALKKHDIVLWHFSNYSQGEMDFARSILNSLEESGKLVFPNIADNWHFDDKVAQSYLLDAMGIPTPKNYIFYSKQQLDKWLDDIGVFPIVAKLKAGSGSNNVILIENKSQLLEYAKNMFGDGLGSEPSFIFKLISNLRSTTSIKQLFQRAKRIPEFLFSRKKAKGRSKETGYVYLQEFIKNDSFDLKIAVVNGKLSFIGRRVRGNDFRASGGGSLFYDAELISPEIINLAFEASRKLNSICTGYDIVVDNVTGIPQVIEVSYGFSHSALLDASGYFDASLEWHDQPLNAPKEILIYLANKYSERLRS